MPVYSFWSNEWSFHLSRGDDDGDSLILLDHGDDRAGETSFAGAWCQWE